MGNEGAARPPLLIVDDDPLITDSLAFALGTDYEVLAVDSRERGDRAAAPASRGRRRSRWWTSGCRPRRTRPEEGFRLIGDLLAHSPEHEDLRALGPERRRQCAPRARARRLASSSPSRATRSTLKRVLDRAREAPRGRGLRAHRLQRADGEAAQPDRAVRALALSGADRRRVGQRQGAGGPEPASALEPQRPAVPRAQLRRARPDARSRPTLFGYAKGAFTGATTAQVGLLRGRAGRQPVPRRDRRAAARAAGEAAARARERRVPARGGDAAAGFSARASSPPPTATCARRSSRAASAPTSTTACRCCHAAACRRCASWTRDKVLLLEHFRQLYAAATGVPPFTLDGAAEARWLDYAFPGNVRELRNIVIRLTTKYGGQSSRPRSSSPSSTSLRRRRRRRRRPGGAGRAGAAQLERARQLQPRRARCSAWERGYIEAALRLTRGNVSQAAKLLGINRTTLYSRMGPKENKNNGAVPRALRPQRAAVPHHPAHRLLLRRRRPRRDARRPDLRDAARRGHRQGLGRGRQRQDHAVPRAHGAAAGARRHDLPRVPVARARRDPSRDRRRSRARAFAASARPSRCASCRSTSSAATARAAASSC